MAVRRMAAIRRGVALGAAGLVLGQGALVLATAGTAQAAPAPRADRVVPTATVCGKDLAKLRKQPLGLSIGGLRTVYRAGGTRSEFRLRARNLTGGSCPQVLPVVVFGSQRKPLRGSDLRLQWRTGHGRGAAWRKSPLLAEGGVLVAQLGPRRGLTLAARQSTTVPLRMRFASGAPTGQWGTIAFGYEPVQLDGETVPFPVGVSDPQFFRVRGHSAHHGGGAGSRSGPAHRPQWPTAPQPAAGPQLAVTGGSGLTGAAGIGAVLALGGGAGLLGFVRRRGAVRSGAQSSGVGEL